MHQKAQRLTRDASFRGLFKAEKLAHKQPDKIGNMTPLIMFSVLMSLIWMTDVSSGTKINCEAGPG